MIDILDLRFTNFKEYLIRENRRVTTVQQMLQYVKRYGHILQTGDASELLTLTVKNRQHAMRSLAALSKFQGCYDSWQQIKNKHQLKWSNSEEESLRFFQNFLNGQQNYTVMLKWIKQAVSLLPSHYGNILLYNTLTGLRPSEAMESLRLIRADPDYFNKDLMVLEHFRHPKIFLRRTKKAYITLVIPEILSLAKRCELEDSWNGLYCALKRRGLGSHTKYCRAIFATYLRKRGMESEIIDIFQGRVPKTVFAKYYFRPDFEDSCTRMKAQLRRLHREIAVT